MAFPVGVSVCTVTAGRSFSAFGSNATIKVTVTPVFGSAQVLIWNTTGDTMHNAAETFTGTAGEAVSVDLPFVDQSGWVDSSGAAVTMWYYSMHVLITPETGGVISYTKSVQPLVGTATLDLDRQNDNTTVVPVNTVDTSLSALDGRITAEVSRATTAEGTKASTSALTTETNRATAAELALQNLTNSTFVTGLNNAYASVGADQETRKRTASGVPRVITIWGGHDDETPILTNCTTTADTVNFKLGDRGTKITTTGAVTATASLDPISLSQDPLVLPPTSAFGIWLYVEDVTKLTSATLQMYTAADLSTLWTSTDFFTKLVTGWNFLRFWTGNISGGTKPLPANWLSFYRCRLVVASTAATSVTIGHVWAECPEKAQILFILDGVYTEGMPIYNDLKARGIPVTFAQDCSQTGVGGNIDLATLKTVAAENNNSIGFHGYAGTTDATKTAAELRSDTMQALKWLSMNGFTGGVWRAAFFGNSAAQFAAIKPLVLALATSNSQSQATAFPFIDRWNIPRVGIHGASTATMDGWFADLAVTNGLFVCYTHRLKPTSGGPDISVAEWAYFLTKLDAMLAAGTIEGVTFEMLFARGGGRFRRALTGARVAEYDDPTAGTTIQRLP